MVLKFINFKSITGFGQLKESDRNKLRQYVDSFRASNQKRKRDNDDVDVIELDENGNNLISKQSKLQKKEDKFEVRMNHDNDVYIADE